MLCGYLDGLSQLRGHQQGHGAQQLELVPLGPDDGQEPVGYEEAQREHVGLALLGDADVAHPNGELLPVALGEVLLDARLEVGLDLLSRLVGEHPVEDSLVV